MKKTKLNILYLTLIVVVLQLTACNQWESNYVHLEPAHLEHLENSELNKMTLTEKAVERTDIKTAPVTEETVAASDGEQKTQLVTPYSSVIYDAHGHIWVYTNPEPLVYVRHEIKIDRIKGDKAYLFEGPPVGTVVVTQGAAELYGTEYEVGH